MGECNVNKPHGHEHDEDCKCHEKMHKHHEGHCCYSEKLLKVADEAWMEVLKDKLKAEIEKNEAADLERLAQIIGKANAEKWRTKISAKVKCEEYQDTLKEFFKSN